MSERRLLGLVFLLTLALVLGSALLLRARTAAPLPSDDPRGVVQQYLQALEKGDYRQAYRFWDPQQGLEEAEFVADLRETEASREGFSVAVGEVAFPAPEEAEVILYLTPLQRPPFLWPAPRARLLRARLRRRAGRWYLVALPPPWGPVPSERRWLPTPPVRGGAPQGD